jgi:hydroxyethylthiazole kinase-like sugar kinase family protein
LQVLQRAIDTDALPTPIEMVMNMFWLVTFSGCLMSAITAAFAKLRN